MDRLLQEIEQRWELMFASLAAGDDVSPALRLRTEGLMEAALLVHCATREEIENRMGCCYRQAFGRTLDADFGADWRDFYPFPRIPAMGSRAPVYQGTRD